MVVRFGFGLCTLLVLLLFRNYFTVNTPLLRTGATGIGEVLAVGAVGVLSGAVFTAPVVRRIGRTRYVMYLLSVTAMLVVGFGSQFTVWSTLITAFAVAFAFQGSKVCMDSVVQAEADDAYLGRVVALYDTAINICYVLAFGLGVLILPATGRSVGAVVLVGALLLMTGVGYRLIIIRRSAPRPGRRRNPTSSTPLAPSRPGPDDERFVAGVVPPFAGVPRCSFKTVHHCFPRSRRPSC